MNQTTSEVVTVRGMDSQRSHRSVLFLPLINEVDFWVEVNFWKMSAFVAYKKMQNFIIKKKINRLLLGRKILIKTKPDLPSPSPPSSVSPSSVLTRGKTF